MTEQWPDGASNEADTRAARLARFRGPVEQRDAEVVEFWRNASRADHARAMIELANYAEQMAAQTGLGKNPNERFPGFPTKPTDSAEERSTAA